MRKGKWWLIIGILVVMAAGIWVWQAATSGNIEDNALEDLAPEITVASAKITDFSRERIEVVGEVVLKNPYPVSLSSRELSYEVFVDSIKIIEDIYEEEIEIRSSDSTVIELPMEILADSLDKVFTYFENSAIDSADYRLKAAVQTDVPIAGEQQFDMEISRRMPVLQMLDVELSSMDANLLSSDEGMEVVIEITNPNNFGIAIRNGSFRFELEDDLEVRGQMEEVARLPANGTSEITVMARKESGSLTQSGLDVLFDQEGTGFTYFFDGVLSSENEMLNGAQMQLRVQGTLDEIVDALGL